MESNHLRNLQSSGVWPEGLQIPQGHPAGKWTQDCATGRHSLLGHHVKDMLIVAMLDRLPNGWKVHRYFSTFAADRLWVVKQPDGAESINPDLFVAAYDALVSAGIVKEEQ